MRKIEFVEYTGKYPNLCNGELILKIDDEIVEIDKGFISGGWYDMDAEIIIKGPWRFIDTYENFTEEEMEHITKLMNDNIPQGCCGGCI